MLANEKNRFILQFCSRSVCLLEQSDRTWGSSGTMSRQVLPEFRFTSFDDKTFLVTKRKTYISQCLTQPLRERIYRTLVTSTSFPPPLLVAPHLIYGRGVGTTQETFLEAEADKNISSNNYTINCYKTLNWVSENRNSIKNSLLMSVSYSVLSFLHRFKLRSVRT